VSIPETDQGPPNPMPLKVIVIGGVAAAKILQGAGLKRVRVLDGGMAVWPFENSHGKTEPRPSPLPSRSA